MCETWTATPAAVYVEEKKTKFLILNSELILEVIWNTV